MSAVVYRLYGNLPARELNRRIKKGDTVAEILGRINRYIRPKLFLRLMVAFCAAGASFIANHSLPTLTSIPFVFGLTLVILLLIATPEKLYTKSDLLSLLEYQKTAEHNRIDESVIRQALQALKFEELTINNIMTPRKNIRFVSGDEPVGPILSSELHDSGHERFPVTGDEHGAIIGTLYLRDLVDYRKSGLVKNIMKPPPPTISQDDTLEQALAAMLKGDQQLAIIIDQKQTIVGLLTVKDIIRLRFEV